MEIVFKKIENEFSETFGFVRQDIVELLKNDQPLHYTVALLVCCACEMLTWHRGLRDDQAHKVFTSLLPDTSLIRQQARPCGRPFATASFITFGQLPSKLAMMSGAFRFPRGEVGRA
jgi:hypothetical protein